MDIAQLAIRTGLPIRRLRYVFDHQILPGMRHAEGRGIPRSFLAFEGFGIALAALLLEAGLKRWLVALCFDAVQIGRSVPISQEPMYQGYVARSGWLEIGDGSYVRLHGEGQRGVGRDFDTGWKPLEPSKAAPQDYEPLVLTRIDLTALRRRVGDD